MSVSAVDKQQPQPCVMCGDKGHSYERCPLAEWDEDTEQVNYLHNDSSHFQRPPFNNASSSSNSRTFYNNAAFNNSNDQASQFGPPKPYIAPARLDYQTTPSQRQPGKLPSQPEVNPRREVMAITLCSGTDYAPPAMQPADHTNRADPTRTVRTSSDAETEHLHHADSIRPAQPVQTNTDTDRVIMTRPVHISAEGQKTREAGKPPPYRPPVPFPRRLAESILNEQFTNCIQVLKQLRITIPFTDAFGEYQIPTYILE